MLGQFKKMDVIPGTVYSVRPFRAGIFWPFEGVELSLRPCGLGMFVDVRCCNWFTRKHSQKDMKVWSLVLAVGWLADLLRVQWDVTSEILLDANTKKRGEKIADRHCLA